MLKKLLAAPLRFIPQATGFHHYRVVGTGTLVTSLEGIVDLAALTVASPTGDEEMYVERTILGDTQRAA